MEDQYLRNRIHEILEGKIAMGGDMMGGYGTKAGAAHRKENGNDKYNKYVKAVYNATGISGTTLMKIAGYGWRNNLSAAAMKQKKYQAAAMRSKAVTKKKAPAKRRAPAKKRAPAKRRVGRPAGSKTAKRKTHLIKINRSSRSMPALIKLINKCLKENRGGVMAGDDYDYY